jgi:glucose/arabinose dehydrogenase
MTGRPFWLGGILSLLLGLDGAAAQQYATPNPLFHKVIQSDIAVDLIDAIKMPPSSDHPPLARLNFLYHAGDGSGRLFVDDLNGKITVVHDGIPNDVPFLDIGAVRKGHFRSDQTELGVSTFAFHPDFAKDGSPGYLKLYTFHTENAASAPDVAATPVMVNPALRPDHFAVLTEWTADPSIPDRVNIATRRELLRLGPWRKDHGGGQLGFDPNLKPGDPDYGLLYIAVGDGGNSAIDSGGKVDIYHQAQNPALPFGKILRINPLATATAPYSVPADNPFVKRPGILPEIWAMGLRNPERFSWDTGGRHRMLIADIGQANIEEIDLGERAANYGWGTYEGRFVVDHDNEKNLLPLPPDIPPGFTFPAAEYDHSDGDAVTGGFVYRGKTMTQLIGKYVFGDIVRGTIFYADADTLESGLQAPIYRLRLFYHGNEADMRRDIVHNADRADLRFGMGGDGEIYVLTKQDGMIRRIAPHIP